MAIQVICDRCKQVTDSNKTKRISVKDLMYHNATGSNSSTVDLEIDLCTDCILNFQKWMDTK